VLDKIQKGIQDHTTFLANAQTKADELTTRTALAALLKSLYSAQSDYQEAEPEQSEIAALIERGEAIDKVLNELEVLKYKKALNSNELAVLLKRYDAQAAGTSLSDTQRQYIQEQRGEKEAKFNARVQKAVEELEKLEARSSGDESPSLVMDSLRQGRDGSLRFLTIEYQPRLKVVEDKLNDRIGEDATEKIQDLFRHIASPQQQRLCLEKLRDLLDPPAGSTISPVSPN
jgi:hypothetical protein